MPVPVAPLLGAAAIVLIAALWPKKKVAAVPADAPKDVLYIPTTELPPDVVEGGGSGGGGGGAPAVKTRWDFVLQSGDTPLGLTKAWTTEATTARMIELSDANPTLQRTQQTPVVYIAATMAGMPVNGEKNRVYSTAYRASGIPVEAQVTSSTPSGGYPNNPIPGSTGKWYNAGATSDTLYPWQIGQTVHIPESWGDPPAGVDPSRVTQISAEYA
jgi:hypothetical protein